jgi:hypothetical protein
MTAARCWLLLSLACLAACSEGTGPLPPDAGPARPRPLARLTLAQGSVELARDGKPARAADIEDLYDQDLIITGSGARAILKFKGGGELELAESSRFRLTASAANVDVDLQTGIISLIDGDGVAMVTPYGRTTLRDETRARLGKDGDGLTLDLLVGEITQLDEDGGTVRVKAGQKLKFQVGAISLMEEGEDPSAKAEPLPVAWLPLEGAAELKAKGDKRFKPAKARVELEAGTAFKVTGSARARLEAPGVSADVAGGTTGTVEGASKKGKRRQVEVSLGGGLLELQFVGDGESELLIPVGGAVARVRGNQRSRVRVVATAKGARIVVVTGEVEVASGDGAPTRVRAGEAAMVDQAKVEVSAVKKPLLLLPTGKRVKVYSVGSQEVGLDLPDELVDVEVASDPGFKELLLAGKAQGFVSLVDPPAQVHWRALDDKGAPLKQGSAKFEREKKEAKGQGKTDRVEESEKSTLYFQGEVPSLTFTWPAAAGAAKYRLRVYRGSKAVVDKTLTETTYLLEAGQLKEGTYSWIAMPQSPNGVDLADLRKLKTELSILEIAFDNSFVGLAISGPANNERTSRSTRARGVAPLGSKLFINGAPVSLDDKGRYDFPVGKSSPLIFRSVARDGSEEYWVRVTR